MTHSTKPGHPDSAKATIVTLTDGQVVKYALGEVVTFILLRLLALALLAGGVWWLWNQIKPWWQQITA